MSLFIDQCFVTPSNEFPSDVSSAVECTEMDESIIYLKQWNKICYVNNHKMTKINFSQQSQMNCKKRKRSLINACGCCQRIIIIFKYCQQVKENTRIYPDIFAIFPRYNLTQFQNDMDHIIKHHGKDVNEGLFINEIGSCHIKDCRVPAREARNGVKSPRMATLTHCTHIGLQHIIRHLFIEEYHGYLFHPIPIHSDSFGTIYPDRNDRFVSDVSYVKVKKSKNKIEKTLLDSVAEDNDNDADHEQKYNDYKMDTDFMKETSFFRFGHKFTYHRFKGDKKMSEEKNYVGCKYENLKKELIDDKTKNFTVAKWNILIARSSALSEKDESKNIKAKQTKYGWNTALGKSISIARIVALGLYTDYAGLSFKLCETYRIDIGDKKKQRKAHSRFAHWAKLLTSTVDIFGEEMRSGHKFFRGLSGPKYVFPLFSTEFNAPCSTTTRPGIAWSFAFSGIVVQIEKPEWKHGARFMNVVPFSAYKHEDEHLFVGPDNFLKIACIHQNLSTKITSTEPLLLLQMLTRKMANSIDMKKYIQTAARNNILNDLCHNLKEIETLENKENSNEYKYELTNFFLEKTAKLYIKVKLIQDLVRCWMKGKGNQKNGGENLLFWLIDGDVDVMYKKKEFQINFFGINQLFRNITEVTFDFRSSNLKLSHTEKVNNITWDNIIQYMFRNKSSKPNDSKVCKIVLRRLAKLPSNELINRIQNKLKLKDSRWDVRAVANTIIFFRGSTQYIHRKQNPKKHEKHSKSDKLAINNIKHQKDKPKVQRKRKALSDKLALLKSKLPK